jgi:DNA-binding NarL/FixJ family response regulator
MGGELVIVGRNEARETYKLPVLLTERGRVVVTEKWPPERLVDFAVESGAGALVLHGPLSSGALRSVSDAVECRPELGAIVVAPVEPNVEVLIALASGFSGYLPAGSPPAAVADAVDAVLAGGMVLPRASALPLVEHLRAGGRGVSVHRRDGSAVELTGREWEVLLLLRQARSTAEIAARLCVSTVTVRTHVAVLVQKLGVADRAALMAPPVAANVRKHQRGARFGANEPVDTVSPLGGKASTGAALS